jgi:LysR family transcriptional regulator, regulator for bpeEF and oprC
LNKFQAISAFTQVAERGSFTAAAKKLGMSSSAITKSIAWLEDDLGTQLFVRTTRRIALTDFGKMFYDRCIRIVADLEDAETAMRESSGAIKGRVRMVTPFSFGRVTVIPALPLLYQSYPEISLEIVFSDSPLDMVAEGFDLAVRSGDLGDSRLIRRVLLTGPMATVAAPSYLAKHGTPKTPEDLAQHNCIVGGRFGPEWLFRRGNEVVSVLPKGNLRVESGDAVREAAAAGLGIAYSTWWLFRKDLEAGRVVSLLDGYQRGGVPVSVLYPARRHLPRKVAAVIDFLCAITRNERQEVA